MSNSGLAEPYRKTFTALPQHIDVMGHVNNAVWVEWVQDIALAHWHEAADPAHSEAFVWLVIRHELDYRGNIAEGESVIGETWIAGGARGAKSIRCVDFRDGNGKILVSATTTWAMIDRASGRLARVRPEILAPFTNGQKD